MHDMAASPNSPNQCRTRTSMLWCFATCFGILHFPLISISDFPTSPTSPQHRCGRAVPHRTEGAEKGTTMTREEREWCKINVWLLRPELPRCGRETNATTCIRIKVGQKSRGLHTHKRTPFGTTTLTYSFNPGSCCFCSPSRRLPRRNHHRSQPSHR
jgi:hypothetical protein